MSKIILWKWVNEVRSSLFGYYPNGRVDVPMVYGHLEDLQARVTALEEARILDSRSTWEG